MASFGFDLILQLFQNLGHVIGINNVVSVVCVSIPVVVEVAGTYLSVLEYRVILLRLSRHVDTTPLALRLPSLTPPRPDQ